MQITQSSDIKELFSKLLVTKNKLNLIKTYYSDLSKSLVDNLDDLYTDLMNEIDWIENQLQDMTSKQTVLASAVNTFTALTSQDESIVNHKKYKEMLDLYNKYINNFYNRMTSLESTYEASFLKNEVNEINSSWKMHYSENRTDAVNVEHEFSSLNFTKDSDIIEFSNSRYVFRTNENYIVDADYKTKNCYITYLDGKTIFNSLFKLQGSQVGYYGEERASIVKMFKLPERNDIYVLIDLCITENIPEDEGDIIGAESDGILHKLYIAKYDPQMKTLSLPLSNTSVILIRDRLLREYEFEFLTDKYEDYFYFFISSYFVRIKVEGSEQTNVNPSILLRSSVDICSAILHGNNLVIPTSDKTISVFDVGSNITIEDPEISFNTDSMSEYREVGEQGIVCNIVKTSVGIFFSTDKSIWKTTNLFVNVHKDPRTGTISSNDINFKDKSSYVFDDNGYFYFLNNNEYIYCVKAENTIVMSPTRYSDRLFFMKGETSNSTAGYAYNRSPNVLNGSTVFYSFVHGVKYIIISQNGEVESCDIETGLWTNDVNLVVDKTITACYDDEEYLYYYASDYKLYRISKESFMTSVSGNSEVLFESTGSMYAMTKYEDLIILGGHNGRVCSYDIKTKVFYKYDDESNEGIVESGFAMGNKNIRAMTMVGNVLVVMGNEGKVASCNTLTKVWTTFNGLPLNGDAIDSKIFNNGSAMGGVNINCCINYLNNQLIVFGDNGRMASFYVGNSCWTNYDGVNPGNLNGPNIYNAGSMTDNSSVRCAIIVGDKIVAGSDNGYLISVDPTTSGITDYKGLSVDVNKSGPGIYYDGSGFLRNSIVSLALDNINGLLLFGGSNAYVSTYSMNVAVDETDVLTGASSGENSGILRPDISKLYYVGRNASDNDYLSSLLIQLSTETLKEYKALYPPRDIDTVYSNFFNNTFYTYKNGDVVYRLSSSFKDLYKSIDGGITSQSYNIIGSDWASDSARGRVIDEPMGYVTKDGTFVFLVEVNKIPHLLISTPSGTPKFYNFNSFSGERQIKKLGHLTANGKDLFYVMVENTNGYLVPALIKFAVNTSMVDLDFSFYLRPSVELMNETENVYPGITSDGNYVLTSVNSFNIMEWALDSYGFNPVKSENIQPVRHFVDDSIDGGFMYKYFEMRNEFGLISNNKIDMSNFLCFFITKNFIFNYAFLSRETGDVIILNVSKYNREKTISVSNKDDLKSSSWDIFENIIYAKQYIPIYGNTRYTDKNYVTLSDITVNNPYIVDFDNGLDGLLGFDVSYIENYSETISNNGSYKDTHVVLSLNTEVYGDCISPNYRVFRLLNGKGNLIAVDETDKEVLVANYSERDANNRIRHTNSIHKFIVKDAFRNTPIRGMQNAWYKQRLLLDKDSNAFMIKCKLKTIGTERELDAIYRQEAIRYQVMISSQTTGRYILYEVEKSPIMSRMDRETKVASPLFKVLGIDRFNARITELYTSRLSGRQTAFIKVTNDNANYPNGYVSKTALTFDFLTYVDFTRVLGVTNSSDMIDVSIRPLNTLPSNVDAQFYIETYKSSSSNDVVDRTEPVRFGFNNIDKSEYRDEFALENVSLINLGLPGAKGFLEKNLPDVISITSKLHSTNNADYPTPLGIPLDLERGNADTYVVRCICHGDGTFNQTTGIVMHTGNGIWKYTPYSVNRKRIDVSYDESGSKEIAEKYDIKIAKAGRNVFKMRRFGIYGKAVINDADFYTSYFKNGASRIAKSEGLFSSYYGTFETVSSIDGYQRRVSKILESSEGLLYRTIKNGYDNICDRKFGHSYDIVDRQSIFELPNYYIQSWWIPAKGYITKGNESLLVHSASEAEKHFRFIGVYRRPFDRVSAPELILEGVGDDTSSGIGSGGQIYDPNKVAFSTLIDMKYPLEHWDNFNDLDFVRVWKDTLTDRTDRLRYVVEKPKDASGNSTFLTYYDNPPTTMTESYPTIDRNLYWYSDDFDWERRGTQKFKYLTGYYYDTLNWKIYFHEIKRSIWGFDSKYDGLNENYTMDKNLSKLQSTVTDEAAWYVPETNDHNNANYLVSKYTDIRTSLSATDEYAILTGEDNFEGVESWPRKTDSVVGEKIETLTSPIPDMVVVADGTSAYNSYASDNASVYPTGKVILYRRGYKAIEVANNSDPTNAQIYAAVTADGTDFVNTTYKSGVAVPDTVATVLNALGDRTAVILASNVNGPVTSNLTTALAKFGVTAPALTGRYSNVFLGYKGASGQIAVRNNVANTFGYDGNVGLIRPFKFSNGSWLTSNFDTDFSATVTQYKANGTVATVIRLPTMTAVGNAIYDRYCGGEQHKWQYAQQYTVSFSLQNIDAKKTIDKTYYKYTTKNASNYNSSTDNSSLAYDIPVYWDVRVPSNAPSTAVVDKQFVSVELDATNLKRKYKFKYYYNNGTMAEVTEEYSYKYKWIYVASGASWSVSGTDASDTNKRACGVTCTEYYQWNDGYIYSKSAATKTVGTLIDSWGVTAGYSISIGTNTSSQYVKNYTLTLTGQSINSTSYKGANETRTLTKTDTAKYSTNTSTSNSTSNIKWGTPTGLS